MNKYHDLCYLFVPACDKGLYREALVLHIHKINIYIYIINYLVWEGLEVKKIEEMEVTELWTFS